MTTVLALTAAALALLLTGLMAGIFAAFSVSVVPGLDRVDSGRAVAAMRSINRVIQNPVFFVMFFGAPVAAVASGALLFPLGQVGAAWLFLAAAGAYLLGAFLPTIVVNVPLNNALDAAGQPDAADLPDDTRTWRDYSPRWTRWNTARAVFSSLSLLLVGLGLATWGPMWG